MLQMEDEILTNAIKQCIRERTMSKGNFSNKCKSSSVIEKSISIIHHINRLMENIKLMTDHFKTCRKAHNLVSILTRILSKLLSKQNFLDFLDFLTF